MERRDFFKLASAGAAAAALGMLGCTEAKQMSQPATDDTGEPTLVGTGSVNFSASCDVLVVGSGIAGLSAAMDPSEAGFKVIVADKNTLLGGESYTSSGVCQAYGAQIQKDAGVLKTADELWEERKAAFDERYPDAVIPPEALLHSISDMRAIWVDRATQTYHASFRDPAEYLHAKMDQGILVPQSGIGGLDDIMNPLRDQLAAQGVEFMTDHELQAFISDGAGALCGARFFSAESLSVTDVQARKIVLATGGYAANQQLFADNIPQLLHVGCLSSLSDGAAMKLAVRIGAATANLDLAGDLAGDVPDVDTWGCFAPVVAVGPDALRFAREDQRFAVPNACFEKDLGFWWTIFDEQMGAGVQSSNAAKTLDGYATRHVGPCESVEELAAACGLPAAALKSTLADYAKACKAGADELFGHEANLEALAAPLHAIKQYPMRFRTIGGLAVDEQLQVTDVAGAPIGNLYACGSCASILSTGFLDNAASGLVAGASVAEALATSE